MQNFIVIVPGLFNVSIITDPPNNTAILRQVGQTNTTVECSVFNGDGTQEITFWSVNNGSYEHPQDFGIFSGAVSIDLRGTALPPERASELYPNFRNHLTISTFSAVLEGFALYCGTGGIGGLAEIGHFPLIIHRK